MHRPLTFRGGSLQIYRINAFRRGMFNNGRKNASPEPCHVHSAEVSITVILDHNLSFMMHGLQFIRGALLHLARYLCVITKTMVPAYMQLCIVPASQCGTLHGYCLATALPWASGRQEVRSQCQPLSRTIAANGQELEGSWQ